MSLTDEQIAQGLAGAYGGVTQSWTFERVNVAGEVQEDLSQHFLGGSYSVSNSGAVRATAQVRLTWHSADEVPVSLLSLYRITEHMNIRGEDVEFPLGLWVLVGMGHVHHEGGVATTTVELQVYTAALVYSTTTQPFHLDSGFGYLAAMRFVLGLFGVSHNLVWQGEGAEPVCPTAYDRPIGTPYYTILKDFADGINYEVPWPGLDGVFVTAPVLPPEDEPFAVVYRDDVEPRMIVGDVRESGDVVQLGAIANGCVAKIDNPFRREWAFVVQEMGLPPGAWRDIAVEADGSHIWVVSSTTAYRMDAVTGAVVSSWATPTSGSRGITVEADGTHVWISATDGNLYRCLASDGTAVSDITFTLAPALAIDIEPDGAHIWAADLSFGFISRVVVADGTTDFIRDLPYVGAAGSGGGIAVEPGGAHWWSAESFGDFRAVRVADSSSGMLSTPRWKTPAAAITGLALDPDGESMWVVTSATEVAFKVKRSGLNDYGLVRYRNADSGSRVSTVYRPESVMVLDSDSDPSMRLVRDPDTAADIAITQLKREASAQVKVDFETLADPRRWINETYFLFVSGAFGGGVRVTGWSRDLSPGARTVHHGTQAEAVTITEVT